MGKKYKVLLERIFIPIDLRALDFARKAHAGEVRHDGSPYINHPIRVALLVTKYKKDENIRVLRAAAYLHDVLENTNIKFEDLAKIFGSQVASLVLELTTDEDLRAEIGKSRYLEIKMKNMSSWALVIKLCDRLDNLYDVAHSTPEFVERYTLESVLLISFLIKNRGLSKTHLTIINDILLRLLELLPDNKEKNAEVENLLAYLDTIRSSKDQYLMSLQRLKKE